MSLRYALLALLTAKPMTGYDLAKAFHVTVGHVWHAPDSQIYPELRRMEGEGLIHGEPVAWGPRATKTQYAITDEGIAAFRIWMDEGLSYPPERDAMHLKAAYFEWASPDAARELFRQHIDHYRARRAQWQEQLDGIRDRTHAIVAARLASDTTHSPRAILGFKAHTYEGFIARADQEIEWAERGLVLVDELESGD